MRFTTSIVLFATVVALLSTSQTTLEKLKVFVDAFISIADETFFVLLCTYCVVPLLIYHMHGFLLHEDSPDNRRHQRQLESAHWKEKRHRDKESTTASGNVSAAASSQKNTTNSSFSYGFFANLSFTVISVLILLRIVKELFGVNVSNIFNFASTLSVGIGFAFNDTINNVISGIVTQMSLGVRHGDEVCSANNDTWYINEVGTLGITMSKRHVTQVTDGTDSEEVFYIQQFVGHTRFANAFSRVSGPYPKDGLKPNPKI